MPAAAVASLTPSIGGMSGNCAGARGAHSRERGAIPADLVLLRLGGLVGGRLVEAFDLGGLAQLGDELGLRLAGEEILDLVLHLFEFRRLLGALVLELDDVPAEL